MPLPHVQDPGTEHLQLISTLFRIWLTAAFKLLTCEILQARQHSKIEPLDFDPP